MKIFYLFILSVFIYAGSFAQGKASLPGDPTARYMRFYPNPAVSVINFEFQKGYDKSSTLQIYNFIGKKIYDAPTSAAKINISLTDFYRGVYIYQLRDKTGKIIESGKFQVVK